MTIHELLHVYFFMKFQKCYIFKRKAFFADFEMFKIVPDIFAHVPKQNFRSSCSIPNSAQHKFNASQRQSPKKFTLKTNSVNTSFSFKSSTGNGGSSV